MDLRITRELVETLITLHDESTRYVYPNGQSGTYDFSSEEGLEIVKRGKSDPHRPKFEQIVDSLDLEMKRELIALMWLGKDDEHGVEQFPLLLEHAVVAQDAAAQYLSSKSELSRSLREGMVKLDMI